MTVKLEDALLQDLAMVEFVCLNTKFTPACVPEWPTVSVNLEVKGLHVTQDTQKLLTLQQLSFTTDVSISL